MTPYPELFLAIVREEALAHIDNIDAAIEATEQRWKAQPEYESLIAKIIRDQLRSLIHLARHNQNIEIRKQNGFYGQPAKVTLATGAVNRVANSVLYTYSINGVSLGALTGEMLRMLTKSEHERARGHEFNSRLCARLSPLVADDQTVAQAVKPNVADKIFKELSEGRRSEQVNGHAKEPIKRKARAKEEAVA